MKRYVLHLLDTVLSAYRLFKYFCLPKILHVGGKVFAASHTNALAFLSAQYLFHTFMNVLADAAFTFSSHARTHAADFRHRQLYYFFQSNKFSRLLF